LADGDGLIDTAGRVEIQGHIGAMASRQSANRCVLGDDNCPIHEGARRACPKHIRHHRRLERSAFACTEQQREASERCLKRFDGDNRDGLHDIRASGWRA
jgi:hypothetical protein